MPVFKNISQVLFSFAICSIAFLMPGFPRITGICIAILFFTWLTDGGMISKLKSICHQRLPLLFIAVYIVYLLGMLYTSNSAEGTGNIILKISMLLFPLIFFAPGRLRVPVTRIVMQFFVLGCLLAAVILLSVALYTFFTTGKDNFTYSDLTRPLNVQPAAFSMYILFGVFALLLPFLQGEKNHLFISPFLSGVLLIFFVMMVFLLSARQEIIAFLLLLPASILYYFFSRKKWLAGIGISGAIVAGLLLVVFLIPETKMRLQKMQAQMDESYSNDAPNSVTMRKVIWQSAMEIISEHPFTGVGTGDVNDALKQQYKKNNLLWPLNDNLNAHNQYFQTAIAVGIPGFLVFIISIIAGFRAAKIRRRYLYFIFLCLFTCCIITECMLEAEAGVVFFAFFNSLLAIETTDRSLKGNFF